MSMALEGVLWLAGFIVVFIGSVLLLMTMILGLRMAYWVTASTLFGILLILSMIWFVTALGPKGPETTWEAISMGNTLQTVKAAHGTYNVADYPDGSWQTPKKGQALAGLPDGAAEVANLDPVLEAFVGTAVNEIPGKRELVAKQVQGPVDIKPGEFSVVEVKMRAADVSQKSSVIAVGKVVPSAVLKVPTLGTGVKEAKVDQWLVNPGDDVAKGSPILVANTPGGQVHVEASASGKVIKLGVAKDDKIVPDAPVATVDVSGQAGSPTPAEVVAVRVLGSVRTPPLYYFLAFLTLFILHLAGLSRAERSRMRVLQPA